MAPTDDPSSNPMSATARRAARTLTAVAALILAVVAGQAHANQTRVASHPALSRASASWRAYTAAQYAQRVDGRDVYDYVAWRAAHRKPGERLAIVAGVDHVAVYDGRVHPTYRLLKEAKSLGYRIYFVTGSSALRAKRLLDAAGYSGRYDGVKHCAGAFEMMSRCKAAYRSHLIDHGYALVVNVGAQEQAWTYGPQGERTIKLRY